MTVRVIPRLDIKGPNLVKGVRFEGLRVLGKPERFARHYYESGADELIYMDVVASLYGRNSLLEIVERTSREIFIPLTVGGDILQAPQSAAVLRAGADKVSLNTAAIGRPQLISEAARRFGSSTILVSIEAKKKNDGTHEAYTDNGRQRTGVDVFEWAIKAAELGAGEIMITSIDREGTGTGFDLELTREISQSVSIPVIACGGAGDPTHVSEAIIQGKADAVSMASLLHYDSLQQFAHDGSEYEDEGNIEFLRGQRGATSATRASIQDVKGHLTDSGIDCRPAALVTASG
jgi:cyclase